MFFTSLALPTFFLGKLLLLTLLTLFAISTNKIFVLFQRGVGDRGSWNIFSNLLVGSGVSGVDKIVNFNFESARYAPLIPRSLFSKFSKLPAAHYSPLPKF